MVLNIGAQGCGCKSVSFDTGSTNSDVCNNSARMHIYNQGSIYYVGKIRPIETHKVSTIGEGKDIFQQVLA